MVDLPGEVSGIIHPLEKWSRYSIYSIPMGHEISVTPLQITTAFSSLVNGGFLYKPQIIKKINDNNGNIIYEVQPETMQKILHLPVSDKLRSVLEGVVSSRGTARKAEIPGYSVAGKTGTAQKIEPDGSYSKSKFVSSFIGFLPSHNPRVIIAVIINEPQGKHYGGTVAAPAFKRMAFQIMRYLEIPPDKKEEIEQSTQTARIGN